MDCYMGAQVGRWIILRFLESVAIWTGRSWSFRMALQDGLVSFTLRQMKTMLCSFRLSQALFGDYQCDCFVRTCQFKSMPAIFRTYITKKLTLQP